MAAPRVIVGEDPAAAADLAAQHIAVILAERVAEHRICNIALCGGTTPAELYRRLAASPLAERVPWQQVQVFWGDERDVPQDNVENNYRLASKTLLDHVPVPASQVHPMPADCRDLAAAAEQYENLVRRLVPTNGGEIPRFDLVLLGMGAEGHTASIFPDTPAMAERNRLVMAQFVPVIGRNRMTFTFPLINAARTVMFLVTGGDKAPAVAGILSPEPAARAPFPASRVQPADGELIVVLDREAAKAAPVAV